MKCMDFHGMAKISGHPVVCLYDTRAGGYCGEAKLHHLLLEKRRGHSLWDMGGLLAQAMVSWHKSNGESRKSRQGIDRLPPQLEWYFKLVVNSDETLPLPVVQVVAQAMAERKKTVGGDPRLFLNVQGDEGVGELPALLFGGIQIANDAGLITAAARHLGDPAAYRLTRNMHKSNSGRLRPAYSLGVIDETRKLVMVWELR